MAKNLVAWAAALLVACAAPLRAAPASGASSLPHYDHIIVVVDENKDYGQIIGNAAAPYLNMLARQGTVLTGIFAEEHPSQGNYFWLFSGSNQNVGFHDRVPKVKLAAANLGAALFAKGLSFKGYAQSLPAIGSQVDKLPWGCIYPCRYGRKHVPWISFADVPDGTSEAASSNLRFADFPSDYRKLPTVAFVIPDLDHDMHNWSPQHSIPIGDSWLQDNLGHYVEWAKSHNSLLIVTFDENDDRSGYRGLTDPAVDPGHLPRLHDLQNRIATILVGAHVKPGYADGERLTHVNLLRTIEAIYGLPKAGAQQPVALRAGITDDALAIGAFAPAE